MDNDKNRSEDITAEDESGTMLSLDIEPKDDEDDDIKPHKAKLSGAKDNSSENNSDKKNQSEQKMSFTSLIFDATESFVLAIVIAVVLLTLVVRTGFVDGSSMEPTMYENDRYLLSDLFYTPAQNDIIVFSPDVKNNEEKLWVKRIIATEGQKVYVNPDDNLVYIDDVLLSESYLVQPTFPGTTENPITVPEGYVFVMGDNRAVSHDSRSADLACVDTRRIIGRLIVRVFPFNKFGFVK